jgi:hypothetical protein
MSITITPIFRFIETSLFEKPKKLNSYIHDLSNNSMDHFGSIWSSEMFASINLNDDETEHNLHKLRTMLRFRERGWHHGKIRKVIKKCRLSYKDRDIYIKRIEDRYNDKKINVLYDKLYLMLDPHSILSFDEIKKIKLQREHEEETGTKTFYFKKEFNRFFDIDQSLRSMLKDLLDDLGLLKAETMISNKVNRKLGTLLN